MQNILTNLSVKLANIVIMLAMLFLTACQTLPKNSLSKTMQNDTFILNLENRKQQQSKLLIADNHGNILQTLTQEQGKIFGLSLSFDKQFLLYHVQHKSFPQVVLFDLKNNQAKHILPKKTNYFGASLSPDNQKLLFSATLNDNPEIFLQNLSEKTDKFPKNLTNNAGIDISPVWFADGKRFLFSADNNAKNQPKLYQYQLDSQIITPIGQQNYQTNVRISPNQQYITFFSKTSAGWQNLLMDLPSQAVIAVRDDELADYVNFSPNGKFLLYPYYHELVIVPVPALQHGLQNPTFLPLSPKKSITIKGLNDDERIKEVVWFE